MKNVHVKLPTRMSINFGGLPLQMGPGVRRVSREVAESHGLRVVTPLPADMPYRRALLEDGRFDHVEALRRANAQELASVNGIGETRATEILSHGRQAARSVTATNTSTSTQQKAEEQ